MGTTGFFKSEGPAEPQYVGLSHQTRTGQRAADFHHHERPNRPGYRGGRMSTASYDVGKDGVNFMIK